MNEQCDIVKNEEEKKHLMGMDIGEEEDGMKRNMNKNLCERNEKNSLKDDEQIDRKLLGEHRKNEDDEIEPPKDKFLLVYISFILLGTTTFLPLTIFSNANDERHEYIDNFQSYLSISSGTPMLLLNLANVAFQTSGDTRNRIPVGLGIMTIGFISQMIFAFINICNYQFIFFLLVIITCGICNMCAGLSSSSINALAGDLPPLYASACATGMCLGGVLSAAMSISAKLIFKNNIQMTGVLFFTLATILVILTLLAKYLLIYPSLFFKFYDTKAKLSREISRSANANQSKSIGRRLNFLLNRYRNIFSYTWKNILSLFFVLFATTSVHPGITTRVRKMSNSFPIPKYFFTEATVFISYHGIQIVASFLVTRFKWPNCRHSWMASTFRFFIVISSLMLTNIQPRHQSWPLLITSDWVFWIIIIFNGFTGGYLIGLEMSYIPSLTPPEYRSTSGMLSSFAVTLGVFTGSYNSLLLAHLVTNGVIEETV